MTALDDTPTEALLDGRYRLGECIGRGGSAIVYRADDTTLRRPVAIKIMRAGIEGPNAGARTRREMRALAAIDHPGLVRLFDARIVSGGPEYLVMEFVDGPSLRALLDDGPLGARVTAQLAADLADALAAAHAAGVVHLDVKPSNVLLARTGIAARPFRAKLTDFGIAQRIDGGRPGRQAPVLGTPAYVAPEQSVGASPSPAADVFSLGVVLLECLTGRPPFSDMSRAEASAARQSVAPPVPEGVQTGWARLLRSMTALDPDSRPPASEVAETVRALARNPQVADDPADRRRSVRRLWAGGGRRRSRSA